MKRMNREERRKAMMMVLVVANRRRNSKDRKDRKNPLKERQRQVL